ncbi:hypothetical protein Sinac_3410 [Singulisphaera acidiphila DSM 18658]|uniref:Uncharacterized protein n=1 Tax=Singulisphaera acidiphila (strain ATCC BAA-1392 / DSM 18658 / VKM B-2454 / MOB10) TaxID=886293 RepID=L0DG70_SINAD|nr:hypothetical protein Sinac_3410 [Singulisphaera acidiphila DSM 18658]
MAPKTVEQLPETKDLFMGGTSRTGGTNVSGSAFWKWVAPQSQWVMAEDRSEPGFEAGNGPTQQGRFDGQTVRWASVPSR